MPRLDGFFVLDAAFYADILGHFVDARRVERGGQTDRFREFCRALCQHAMQRLAPIVVGWNAKAGDGTRMIDELGGLFLERHAMNEVSSAHFGREIGIHVWQRARASRAGAAGCKHRARHGNGHDPISGSFYHLSLSRSSSHDQETA